MKLKKFLLATSLVTAMALPMAMANSFQVVDAKIGHNTNNPDVIAKSTILKTPNGPTEVVLKNTALTLSRHGKDQWFSLNGLKTEAGIMAFVNDEEPNKVFYLVDLKQAVAGKAAPKATQSVLGFDDKTNTWKTYLTSDQVPGTNTKFDKKEIKGIHHGHLIGQALHAEHTGKEVKITNQYYDMFWDKDKEAFGYALLDRQEEVVPQDKAHQQGRY